MENNQEKQNSNTCSQHLSCSVKRGKELTSKVVLPENEFTFTSLKAANTLSASSLRKAVKSLVSNGKLVKVGVSANEAGRPSYVYKKA